VASNGRATAAGYVPTCWTRLNEILMVLDTATTPQALDIPRYRLHSLKGDLKGLWSVRSCELIGRKTASITVAAQYCCCKR